MTVVSESSTGVRQVTKTSSERRRHRLPGSRIGYAYVLPFFVVFLAFSVYPWLDTAWVSLHDTRLSTYDQSSFIGLENYRNLFTNQFFWNAFKNTITIGIISTVPQLCMALGIAHLLNYRLRGRTFFRVAILMPYATSLAAATVIFAELFDPKLGIINWALTSVHLPAVDWQGSKWPSQIAVSSIVIWRWTGYNALIYLAGMQAINNDLYEAAAIDGAGGWRSFWAITLPLLRPVLLFVVVTHIIGSFQLFGLVFVVTMGGPGDATRTVVQHLYETAFQNFFQFGMASAMAWVLSAVILVFSMLQFRLLRGHTEH
jgi:cellobiose transport system permease protein